jgi:hypothetical protein
VVAQHMDSYHMPANHRIMELSRVLVEQGHTVHLVAQFGCIHPDFMPLIAALGLRWYCGQYNDEVALHRPFDLVELLQTHDFRAAFLYLWFWYSFSVPEVCHCYIVIVIVIIIFVIGCSREVWLFLLLLLLLLLLLVEVGDGVSPYIFHVIHHSVPLPLLTLYFLLTHSLTLALYLSLPLSLSLTHIHTHTLGRRSTSTRFACSPPTAASWW